MVRDLVFSGKRHFREPLAPEAGRANSNLADRLRM
jgi:hypothetical protein